MICWGSVRGTEQPEARKLQSGSNPQGHLASPVPLQCCFSTFSQYFYQPALPSASAARPGSSKHQLPLEISAFLVQAHCLIGVT